MLTLVLGQVFSWSIHYNSVCGDILKMEIFDSLCFISGVKLERNLRIQRDEIILNVCILSGFLNHISFFFFF